MMNVFYFFSFFMARRALGSQDLGTGQILSFKVFLLHFAMAVLPFAITEGQEGGVPERAPGEPKV
jgi:hypothetical protein